MAGYKQLDWFALLDAPPASATASALPAYVVRESAKAKNIRLKLTVQDGLEVIIPHGFDQTRIPPLLQKKRIWITEAMKRADEQRKFFEPEPPGTLPYFIPLRALGENWKVEYRSSSSQRISTVERGNFRLIVRGDTDNTAACKAALRRWTARKSRKHLVPWLEETSREVRLPFCKVLVKGQKTRWASCSRHKTISVNHKLLFIPWHLVRYVFIHELCHTIQMNHSRTFWTMLNVLEPDYKRLDADLRKAWRFIPVWAKAL